MARSRIITNAPCIAFAAYCWLSFWGFLAVPLMGTINQVCLLIGIAMARLRGVTACRLRHANFSPCRCWSVGSATELNSRQRRAAQAIFCVRSR